MSIRRSEAYGYLAVFELRVRERLKVQTAEMSSVWDEGKLHKERMIEKLSDTSMAAR